MSSSASTRGPADGRLWPSAEQELLLQAALQSDARAIEAFSAWRSRVDIDEEFGWATLRLMPLVYSNLARLGAENPLLGRLKGIYRRSWYETHKLFQRTEPVVAALQGQGIPVLLLKGAPMVLAYYRNHAHRPMSDLDLCVRQHDAERAIELVTSLGWRPTSAPGADRIRFFHALQFNHPDGGEIDLHWHVMVETPDERLDEMFWSATEPVQLLGTTARMLAPTEQFFHTVLHGIRWNPATPVRWIPDSLTILRTRGDEIDWDRVVALAKSIKVCLRVHLALTYLSEMHAAPVPASVLSALAAQRPALGERMEASFILGDPYRFDHSALAYHWTILADLARKVDPGESPLRFLRTYPHYLRFRWQLSGRREIAHVIARGVVRRLLFRPGFTAPDRSAAA